LRPDYIFPILLFDFTDAKDLIYEGIATCLASQWLATTSDKYDAKDLIYEGIATSSIPVTKGHINLGTPKT